MTDVRYFHFTLWCDAQGCDERFTGEREESRAKVRRRAVRAGWLHVRTHSREAGRDYCPKHVTEGAERAAKESG